MTTLLSPQSWGEICSFPVSDINANFSVWTNFVLSVMPELKGNEGQKKSHEQKEKMDRLYVGVCYRK